MTSHMGLSGRGDPHGDWSVPGPARWAHPGPPGSFRSAETQLEEGLGKTFMLTFISK